MSNNLHLFVEVSQASYDCLTLFYRRNFDLHRLFYPYRQMRLIIYCVSLYIVRSYTCAALLYVGCALFRCSAFSPVNLTL